MAAVPPGAWGGRCEAPLLSLCASLGRVDATSATGPHGAPLLSMGACTTLTWAALYADRQAHRKGGGVAPTKLEKHLRLTSGCGEPLPRVLRLLQQGRSHSTLSPRRVVSAARVAALMLLRSWLAVKQQPRYKGSALRGCSISNQALSQLLDTLVALSTAPGARRSAPGRARGTAATQQLAGASAAALAPDQQQQDGPGEDQQQGQQGQQPGTAPSKSGPPASGSSHNPCGPQGPPEGLPSPPAPTGPAGAFRRVRPRRRGSKAGGRRRRRYARIARQVLRMSRGLCASSLLSGLLPVLLTNLRLAALPLARPLPAAALQKAPDLDDVMAEMYECGREYKVVMPVLRRFLGAVEEGRMRSACLVSGPTVAVDVDVCLC